jgi:hypothetical protein
MHYALLAVLSPAIWLVAARLAQARFSTVWETLEVPVLWVVASYLVLWLSVSVARHSDALAFLVRINWLALGFCLVTLLCPTAYEGGATAAVQRLGVFLARRRSAQALWFALGSYGVWRLLCAAFL